MSVRATALAEKFNAFNDDVIAFVEGCSDEDWQKTTEIDNNITTENFVIGFFIGSGGEHLASAKATVGT